VSKNFWQIKKQSEQLNYGKSATSRIEAYIKQWENRCYSDGIPDEIPDKLLFSGRAPSWKALAICILHNDMGLKKLGLSITASERARSIEAELKAQFKDQDQESLFK
jgi:predicted phosphoadenosine phosphosulfate sulfurtransferase